jgi:hypothetical protein
MQRTEVQQGLIVLPPSSRRDEVVGNVLRLGDGECSVRNGARQDAPDVRVDDSDVALEGECEDGAGRVGPDARKPEQRAEVVGDAPVVLLDDFAGCPVQVAGAAVVPEPAPDVEEVTKRSLRARGGSVEPFAELLEDGRRPGYLRLLAAEL